jgi:hypothetical protein
LPDRRKRGRSTISRFRPIAGLPLSTVVIAGLDPAIHSVAVQLVATRDGMDPRVKPGHGDKCTMRFRPPLFV